MADFSGLKFKISFVFIFYALFLFCPIVLGADEIFEYRLSQSTDTVDIWTAPPSVRIFKEHALPTITDSEVRVYAAANEFEPFQIIVRPSTNMQISLDVEDFTESSIETEIHVVKYVNITQPTDALGSAGPWPDPLWPMEKKELVSLQAGENTSFWITVYVPSDIVSGDYLTHVQIGTSIRIPVNLHVFNFVLPDELHVKSQMNFSHQSILEKYGVTGYGSEYWSYVDKIKQFFIDHRLTPKSVLWSGGLTSTGGYPYIDYDCDDAILTDNEGIWGFEEPAMRYLKGSGLMNGTFSEPFNNGTGFPSFMAVTFTNNDSSLDQRPSTFCDIVRDEGDWYTADNPDSAYNNKWFEYMEALEGYLDDSGVLDKAYYYMANEPQDQADYDAVAWYSRQLNLAAPGLKLMVSEEPRPEIYDHPDYIDSGQIDIWLPVLNNYNPEISHERELYHEEETWIYWLYGTRPPFFNPITLDHPGIESRLTGWFLWKYRVRGIAYYSLNNWSKNPWTEPLNSNHNGDLFMLYPPSEDNTPITYGSNNHRFVPSIRFELMRDSLEDYEYLYLLNGAAQPAVQSTDTQESGMVTGESDVQADKIITGVVSYTRSDNFMYELRRLIGLKIGGEIDSIPDIYPEVEHPRAEGEPGNYYINFQNPDEEPLTTRTEDTWGNGYTFRYVTLAGNDYLQVGVEEYDSDAGFGWLNDTAHFLTGRDPWGEETDERKITYAYDDYAHHPAIFEFDLPSGTYLVEVCVGTPRRVREHNRVVVEGVTFVDDEPSEQFIIRQKEVTVSDSKLTVDIGIWDEYTMLDYIDIEAVEIIEPEPEPLICYEILTDSSLMRMLSENHTFVYGCQGVNNIYVESGATGKLINFPGNNVITFESLSSGFQVTRSGATVSFVGDDGTEIEVPATADKQKIVFMDREFDLIIDSGVVKLGSQTVE
ncbi:conserved exported hypothetical protein [Desulfamplus magnetovallimortis]|uniref:Glycoside hydrolase 123 catalytic domain-containing protein n=1 Tax=Desulfamplus magnetovallimortis TaxID=1246637 RepID=A0A1W1HKY4_9BACT|nr:DUF4091 domain-containing protein [Desulfamplus magnetovallimortis]SLM33129.1 conserved exported hypothetical protein [Desulfamplus magnetovallimortis]